MFERADQRSAKPNKQVQTLKLTFYFHCVCELKCVCVCVCRQCIEHDELHSELKSCKAELSMSKGQVNTLSLYSLFIQNRCRICILGPQMLVYNYSLNLCIQLSIQKREYELERQHLEKELQDSKQEMLRLQQSLKTQVRHT